MILDLGCGLNPHEDVAQMEIERSKTLHKRDDVISTEKNESIRTKLILEMLPKVKFEKILDIGCGVGTTIKALEGRCNEIVGLDIYPIGKERHPELDMREYDLNKGKLDLEDNVFDLVICTDVLEHLFYPNAILSEIKRVLKSTGCAIISLPNAHNIYNRRDLLFGRHISEHGRFDSYRHHYFTSIREDIEFIETQFKIAEVRYQWIDYGKVGMIARFWRNPNLFAVGIMMLCDGQEEGGRNEAAIWIPEVSEVEKTL